MTRELQRAIQAMAVECDDTYAMANSIEDMLDEAIAELEALQQSKQCDGCEYESGDNFKTLIEGGTDIHICALCKRGTNDYFKLKEQ